MRDTGLERLRPGPRPDCSSELSFLYSTCRLKMTKNEKVREKEEGEKRKRIRKEVGGKEMHSSR